MSDEAMDIEPKRPEVSPLDRRLLLLAAAGPLAWLMQLGFGISTVRWMCDLGSRLPLYLVTAAALAATAAALAGCWRLARAPEGLEAEPAPGSASPEPAESERSQAPEDSPAAEPGAPTPAAGARRALAWSGVVLGVFFLLLVAATLVPGLVLEPCR